MTPWKGLHTDRMPTFLGYDQVERMLGTMLNEVAAWKPDAAVAIVRGGLVPGTMISCMLGLKLFMIGWDRTTQATTWIGPAPDTTRILLVDDCCATGQTMASVRAALQARQFECATLAVVHDPETTRYIPDFSHPMTDLFRFPWERGEATPAARHLRATGAAADRRTELPFFGLDLSAIVSPVLPFPAERAVAITIHPETEREATEAWLAARGLQSLPLECRPAGTADDIESLTRFKAVTATRWGCTHFVESNAEQAIRIAAAAPHIQVLWWPVADTRAWSVGAAVSAAI